MHVLFSRPHCQCDGTWSAFVLCVWNSSVCACVTVFVRRLHCVGSPHRMSRINVLFVRPYALFIMHGFTGKCSVPFTFLYRLRSLFVQ